MAQTTPPAGPESPQQVRQLAPGLAEGGSGGGGLEMLMGLAEVIRSPLERSPLDAQHCAAHHRPIHASAAFSFSFSHISQYTYLTPLDPLFAMAQ